MNDKPIQNEYREWEYNQVTPYIGKDEQLYRFIVANKGDKCECSDEIQNKLEELKNDLKETLEETLDVKLEEVHEHVDDAADDVICNIKKSENKLTTKLEEGFSNLNTQIKNLK